MVVVAATLIAALERRGMHPIPFRSSGGKGIHLFLVWDEPQDAYSVRHFMADVLTEIGYANGTSGVGQKQIEIFPKQDAVAPGRFGNQFILPLAGSGSSVPLDRSRGLAPLAREAAIGIEWLSSPSVPVAVRPVHVPRSGDKQHDLEMLREALFTIPNDYERGGDYEWWFKILCSVKEAGGEDAREIAREWSEQHDSHKDINFDHTWESIEIGKPDGAPADYVFFVAEQNGWHGRTLADFDVVPPDEWPTPERIGTDLPPVPQMDVEALLPAPLAGYVMDAAHRKVAPPEFVAVSLLVSLGALIGARCGVRPKLHDDWIVVPNLWGAIIAPPSKKKSPSMADGTRPLKWLAAQAREKYAKALEAYQEEVEQFDVMMAAAKKAMAKAADKADDEGIESAKARVAALKDSKPQPPILKRYTTNDSTIEKLGDLLAENPQGLLTERDELAGLLTSFTKTGHESDRAFYLEAWNGTDGHEIDRIGRGSLYIPNLALSVLGGIQPERLERYLDGAARDVGNDGLLARFQLMVWPDPLDFEWRDTLPDKALRDAVYHVFEVLDDDFIDFIDSWGADPADQYRRIPSFKLSPPAAQAFISWDTKLQREIMPSCPAVLQEHFGKYEKLVAGLALILDMAERAHIGGIVGPIREGPMLKAIAWADFLGAHARRVYHLFMHPEVRAAQRLSEFLVQRKLPDPFTTADVQRKGWAGLGSPKQIVAALEFLESVGWVRPAPKPTRPNGGRPSTAWEVNPKIHSENAKEEPIKPTKPGGGGLNRFSRHSPGDFVNVFSDAERVDL
jgi:hypothetical protein